MNTCDGRERASMTAKSRALVLRLGLLALLALCSSQGTTGSADDEDVLAGLRGVRARGLTEEMIKVAMRGREVVPVLVQEVARQTSTIRVECIEVLGIMRGCASEALPELLRQIEGADEALRRSAILSFARLRWIDDASLLRLVKVGARSGLVEKIAILGALGETAMGRAAVVDQLLPWIHDEMPIVREHVLLTLHGIAPEHPKVTVALLRALGGDADADVRTRVAQLLGGSSACPAEAVPALVSRTADKDGVVARAAVTALGEYGVLAQAAAPRLRELRDAGSPELAGAAREALDRIGASSGDAER